MLFYTLRDAQRDRRNGDTLSELYNRAHDGTRRPSLPCRAILAIAVACDPNTIRV